ncbi:synapse-associated protein 1-like isoform X2 [Branchiostoma floridae]|uniref:Synapse-associated protein 1 n=1 Tax=Branchiostoma floridae TaxID=7739 RepID=A0A9J7HU48_BRAFL|nr:synapse-associated protein 1-like isoform X2 [Branchiostoma floridae]
MLSSLWGGQAATNSKEEEKVGEKGDNSETKEGEEQPEEKSSPESGSETKSPEGGGEQVDYTQAAKAWGSFLVSVATSATKTATQQAKKVTKSVQQTAKDLSETSILGDFQREQDKFLQEKQQIRTELSRREAAVPPWVGYNEEAAMKSQILALSQDKRNFMRNPPAGVQFQFDYEAMFPVAMATLQEDSNLQKMRFELVPKQIKEENFWRNYFYRVSLIKQSTQLSSMAQDNSKPKEPDSKETPQEEEKTPPQSIEGGTGSQLDGDSSSSSSHGFEHLEPQFDLGQEDLGTSPSQHEFASDAFEHTEVSEEEMQKAMEQLGMDKKDETTADEGDPKKEDVPEWEKELQKELQEYEVVDQGANEQWEKEIEDMLGLEENEEKN